MSGHDRLGDQAARRDREQFAQQNVPGRRAIVEPGRRTSVLTRNHLRECAADLLTRTARFAGSAVKASLAPARPMRVAESRRARRCRSAGTPLRAARRTGTESGKVWIRAASRTVSVRFCSGWMYQ